MLPAENRQIVHMDLDAFFVSVVRLQDSRLEGIPLIIGGKSDRGVVTSCSYEARAFGVHSAMPMRLAMKLCPDATVMQGDTEQYSYYSNMITDIIAEQVPVYEKSSIDEFYLDLTGMDRFFGCYKLACELREKIIKESGLPISFGLSANKTVSKVATGEAKPNGHLRVDKGTEKPFLSPLSIKKIPQLGESTFHLLKSMGVVRVGTLQKMPVELMERVLGKNGRAIWKKANGIDQSPLVPYSERKSISTERTFEKDTIDVVGLKAVLVAMTEKLASQLRSEQKLTACVTVKIRYSNFDTHTMQARIAYTSGDHILIPKVKELFDRLFTRRMRIRLIGVRFSHLVHGGYQINLFDDTEEMINLYQALDHINGRFGNGKVQRAVGIGYKHRTFNPFGRNHEPQRQPG